MVPLEEALIAVIPVLTGGLVALVPYWYQFRVQARIAAEERRRAHHQSRKSMLSQVSESFWLADLYDRQCVDLQSQIQRAEAQIAEYNRQKASISEQWARSPATDPVRDLMLRIEKATHRKCEYLQELMDQQGSFAIRRREALLNGRRFAMLYGTTENASALGIDEGAFMTLVTDAFSRLALVSRIEAPRAWDVLRDVDRTAFLLARVEQAAMECIGCKGAKPNVASEDVTQLRSLLAAERREQEA